MSASDLNARLSPEAGTGPHRQLLLQGPLGDSLQVLLLFNETLGATCKSTALQAQGARVALRNLQGVLSPLGPDACTDS